ncbi:unknown [Bacteroides fragilis CAG:558]|nr:unknown [Bacteroides fragilis CAG:558]
MNLVFLPIHFHLFSQIVKKVFPLSFHVWRKIRYIVIG